MSKRIISVALVALMLLAVALPASAAITKDKVEIRGTVASATKLYNNGINGSGVSWSAESFAGFWYDLKENKSTETLEIKKFKGEREVDKEDLWYNTKMEPIQFKVNKEKNRKVEYGLDSNKSYQPNSVGGGYYGVTGWFAEKYVAINGKNNKLAKLIYEQETADKKTMAIGETWDLGQGYTLTAQSIDAKASPRQAWLVLNKDNNKLDDKIIEAAATSGSGTQGVYTYYANMGGETNVPIFVTYVDSVFAGQTSDMVQLRYTWLISDSVTEVKGGDKYGIFKVDTTEPLRLKSDSSITLSKDSKVDLAGDMKFRVSDTDIGDVRFYPMVERTKPGTYEVRGTVASATNLYNNGINGSGVSWSAESFAGFWYDLKENKSTETLEIKKFKGEREVDKEDLWYNTKMEPIQFKVNKEKNRNVEYGLDSNKSYQPNSVGGGYYGVTGWFAEKYVAINGKNNKLAKLVYEQETADKKTMAIGETWDLGQGYTLTAQSIDAKASPRQAWLVLNKDNNKLDDKIIEAAATSGSGTQGVYTYYANMGGETNVPIFVTYVDSVFAGQTSDMVQLRYTWLISDSVTEVKGGDKYGIFKVDTTEPLRLKSDSSITLSKDSKVDLAGDMKFRVSDTDNGDVRFYPMVQYQIGGPTPPETPTPTNFTPKPTNTTPKPPTNVTPFKPPTNVTEGPAVTEKAKPSPTKPVPGFETYLAVAGLLAVAYLVLRQKK